MNLASPLTASPIRTDERHERNDSGIGKEPGDFADPAHILVAIVGGKAKIGVDAMRRLSPSSMYVGWRRSTSNRSTSTATVDLPEPESPVNQIVAPFRPR